MGHQSDARCNQALSPHQTSTLQCEDRGVNEVDRLGAAAHSGDWSQMRVCVVGRGRMGRALVASLREAGFAVQDPIGRERIGDTDADLVLLAVPDAALHEVAQAVPRGRLVAHLSGAMTLDVLAPHECFSMHPLLTVTGETDRFHGAYAAVSGSSDRAVQCAQRLASVLGMTAMTVAAQDRGAYHAAATIASNFLVTLEGFAEQLAATAGVDRAALVPLVRAAVQNWATQGAPAALTGPIARGDEATIVKQRAAVAERLPQQLALFDTLVTATRTLSADAASQGAA
jgi:predicted short-subunit dehydrogenase-like oxidoreductase (DUF2520 family)